MIKKVMRMMMMRRIIRSRRMIMRNRRMRRRRMGMVRMRMRMIMRRKKRILPQIKAGCQQQYNRKLTDSGKLENFLLNEN